jgi:hypothetical protein
MEFDEKSVLRVVEELYGTIQPPSPARSEGSSSQQRRKRLGGKESYGTTNVVQQVRALECERCYRVLTYKQTPTAGKVLVDLLDGKVFSFKVPFSLLSLSLSLSW